MNGALVINKDRGLTSHDVVLRVRKLLRTRAVGHLGTLDPIATGVLPLLVGVATRLQQFYRARRKRYEGRIRFGFGTDTYDADGHPLGEQLEVRIPRATFAEFPRREIRFYRTEADWQAKRPALTIFYLGVPDTTPEFLSEAALDAYLTDALTRIRAADQGDRP